MSRHTSCNGVNGVANIRTIGGELIGELTHLVLCLSKRHPVTRNDDHTFGIAQHASGCLLCLCGSCCRSRSSCCCFHLLHDLSQRLLGIAQHHEYTFARVERILHTCITGLEVEVTDDDLWSLIHIQHGHSIYRSAFCIARSGIHHIVGTDHQHGICFGKVVVDGIHFVEQLIRHVSFAQQYIHVSRHTSCNGVNGVANIRTIGGELVGELTHLVLRLSKRHTVTRNDDHTLGIAQHASGSLLNLLGGCHGYRSCSNRCGGRLLRSGRCSCRRRLSSGSHEDGHQLAIHCFTHDLCQQQTAGSDNTPHGNQQNVSDGHTCNSSGHPAKRVQQRDRDGHVGSTYADGKEESEES